MFASIRKNIIILPLLSVQKIIEVLQRFVIKFSKINFQYFQDEECGLENKLDNFQDKVCGLETRKARHRLLSDKTRTH